MNRGRLRSTEVDQGRDGVWAFFLYIYIYIYMYIIKKSNVWAISRRPEACRSSGSHQIVDLCMLYPVEVVAGLSYGKNIDLLAEEGSKFEDCSREHLFEISMFSAR